MVATLDSKEHMKIIGADGLPVGTVDKVVGERIKLTRDDGHGGKMDHHHFLPVNLAADIEGDTLRLSPTAAVAMTFREEESGKVVTNEPMSSAKDSAFAFSRSEGKASGDAVSATTSQKSVPVPPVRTTPEAKKSSTGIGLGAALGVAALGAAALGASKLAGGGKLPKIGKKDARDAIPLDDDETMRLISSAKVEGTRVLDRDGMSVGTIQSFMVDKYTGRVAYAILSFGGTFGFGATLFPLPWGALDYDDAQDGYVLDLTKDQLASAPKFEARDAPEFDAPYRTRIVSFYRAM